LPSWGAKREDKASFFDAAANTIGKSDIILAGAIVLGLIGYDGLDPAAGSVGFTIRGIGCGVVPQPLSEGVTNVPEMTILLSTNPTTVREVL
jgi:hypothetical protein